MSPENKAIWPQKESVCICIYMYIYVYIFILYFPPTILQGPFISVLVLGRVDTQNSQRVTGGLAVPETRVEEGVCSITCVARMTYGIT